MQFIAEALTRQVVVVSFRSPSQLPSYTIRILKKTVPTGGVSDYNDIRSLWQPYGTFNNQNLISADIDFDAHMVMVSE